MGKRTLKYSTGSYAIIAVVLGILLLVNFISTRRFYRGDLTEKNIYTVSDNTREIVSGLADIVNIKVYFSRQLPPYLVNHTNQVKDILSEYRAYSHGNILVEYEDPSADEEVANRTRRLGIPEVRLNVIEKDKREVMNVFLGITVQYADRVEVLPVVKDTFNLEYDLTTAILKVTEDEEMVIGYLTGHDEPDLEEDLRELKKALEKRYKLKEVRTKGGEPVEEDIITLIIAGPKKLTNRDKYEIDQFLMRGGRLILLIDPIDLQEGLMASPLNTGMDDMLASYGLKFKRELVLDRINSNASFDSGFVKFSLPYPFWPRILKKNLDSENPIVNQLDSITLPWSAPLEFIESKVEGFSTSVLARSSNYSWTQKGRFNLNPQQRLKPRPDEIGTYKLALLINGSFASFFQEKEIPEVELDDEEKDDYPEPGDEERESIEEGKEASILLVGTSHLIRDNMVRQFPQNLIFLLNAVDQMTFGEELIGIRSRKVAERPLKEINENNKSFIKFVNTFGVSFLLVLFGVVRFYFKRRDKRMFESMMVKR